MNSKRQTIWLVSMLSLMVVLSAYYLFTEDVDSLQFTSTGITDTAAGSANEIIVDTGDLTGAPAPAGASTEAPAQSNADAAAGAKTDTAADAKTDEKTNASVTPEGSGQQTTPQAASGSEQENTPKPDTASSAKSDAAGTGVSNSADEMSAADAKVLEQLASQQQAKGGSEYFTNLGLTRNEELAKQSEKWLTIISDPKQTAEAAANAQAELRKIQDNEAKITSLEETLTQQFPQAVITEEASKWRVTVQSNKLDKSQAVNIVEQVMKEMGVGPDKIIVQYVP
ncbi:SpoIIIAH-like family protein [Paenibacillus xerothermodurans]|uniref:SpoIIIAH-like family protein n=1 Tax=Paenibacillus xerothermodurans TaxID=1977292 RepID=A0A2W1NWF9_PAEXE|nr:SpoIIIAH-like family protein [Paenibacillus xerothermodurans]PZE22056.1 hypothetical protein CBW46_006570 [Paenibacillus xerothermodurans]